MCATCPSYLILLDLIIIIMIEGRVQVMKLLLLPFYKYTTTSSDGSRKALLQMWCAGRWAIMTEAHMDQSSKCLGSTAYSIHNSKFRFKQGNNSLLIFAILPTAVFHLQLMQTSSKSFHMKLRLYFKSCVLFSKHFKDSMNR
jgi:hypothetical protein